MTQAECLNNRISHHLQRYRAFVVQAFERRHGLGYAKNDERVARCERRALGHYQESRRLNRKLQRLLNK